MHRRRTMNRLLTLGFALLTAGCSSSSPCAAGSSRACPCIDGRTGAQTCNAFGAAYSVCVCSAAMQDALGTLDSLPSQDAVVVETPAIDNTPAENLLQGTYEGEARIMVGGGTLMATVTFRLTQTGMNFAGDYAGAATAGTVEGLLTNDRASFTLRQRTPCMGTFIGVGRTFDAHSRLEGSYSGNTTCTGEVRATFSATRL